MPPKKKPVNAATAILRLIDQGKAANAADAVRQHPELEAGLTILESALQPAKPAKGKGRTPADQPPVTTRPKPSGSLTLSRL